jgi:hypothetical protein
VPGSLHVHTTPAAETSHKGASAPIPLAIRAAWRDHRESGSGCKEWSGDTSAISTTSPLFEPWPRSTTDLAVPFPSSSNSLQAESQIQVRAEAFGPASRQSSNVASITVPRGRTTRDSLEARRHQSVRLNSRDGPSVPEASASRIRRSARVDARTSSARLRSAALSPGGIVLDIASARRSSALAIPPSSCARTDNTASFSSVLSEDRSFCFPRAKDVPHIGSCGCEVT